jgi:hypothetical protein
MSARSILLLGCVAIVVGAAFIAWRAHGTLGKSEAALATAHADQSRLAADESRARAKLAAAENERAARRAELDALRAAQRATAPVVAQKPPPGPPNPMDRLQNDPKLQVRFLAAQRTRLARTYGPFLRMAGLSAADAQKFSDLMVRRLEKNMDLDAVARDRGLPRNAPEIVALQREAAQEFDRDQQALLGPAGYAQFKDYERATPAREIVERFVGAAVINDVPMTWPQAEQFTRVIAEASPAFQAGKSASMPTIDWPQVDARAANVLSPAQLALFQRIEPIGGGASRWSSQLQQAMDAARNSASPETNDVLNTLGKKGPGG